MKKRLVSGIKPTGNIHIGNYFGAMKQFLELQDKYESYIFIADLHALNQIQDPKILSKNILDIANAYIAIGLDTNKITIFRQSDIPYVTELCWIFNSITPMSMLKRAHAYKDAMSKNVNINLGLFDYPVLMAADILLYGADLVPVGQDQKQHLEITQEIARLFNNIYGETFSTPSEYINEEVSVVKGLDGRKMSKSYKNTIGLFDEEKTVRKKVMSIVTDSKAPNEPKDPESCNIFSYHKLFSLKQLEDLRERYISGSISYKESKEILHENINSFLNPIRMRKAELDSNPDYVMGILKEGQIKAEQTAFPLISKVRKKTGLKVF
jgi:tryptophanyl-tRNA synthetase